ncbi:site-specific integrase [Hydrogenophaga sp. BPS33]|uniref:site-specific integrase n=1 Tax=Hydrogenophaga sp. BPS33 TaxID=2651974 RepID=UPI00131F8D9B|nr:site-specific integrase [Hydrogenophaga sp. BPS33]QHE86408.1 tyrosine-type recombinase/integrase [Hydrogenophaga sp. BPS33]
MPTVTLSTSIVNTATCPEGRSKIDLYDTAVPGFILEVRASGGKTYHLRYRDQYGKQRQYKIGDAASINFTRARDTAQRVRSRVVGGDSPMDERRAQRTVPTLSEFIRDVYMPHIRAHRRNYQSTVSFLKHHILPRFGSRRLDEITPKMIGDAHDELKARGYALSTANKMPTLFKIFYNLGRRMKVQGASNNPAQSLKLFQLNNGRERYLTAEEVQRLRTVLEACPYEQMRVIVPLLLMLGCRKRELLEARWEHVDLERRMWHIPMSKSGRARNVPLSSAAVDVLASLPRFDGCSYVVPNPSTLKPWGNLHHQWDAIRKRAGLDGVRIHDLRHSFASNLVNSGRSIYEVGRLLGHTQVKTTQRYAHLSDTVLMSAMEEAANAVASVSCAETQKVA